MKKEITISRKAFVVTLIVLISAAIFVGGLIFYNNYMKPLKGSEIAQQFRDNEIVKVEVQKMTDDPFNYDKNAEEYLLTEDQIHELANLFEKHSFKTKRQTMIYFHDSITFELVGYSERTTNKVFTLTSNGKELVLFLSPTDGNRENTINAFLVADEGNWQQELKDALSNKN